MNKSNARLYLGGALCLGRKYVGCNMEDDKCMDSCPYLNYRGRQYKGWHSKCCFDLSALPLLDTLADHLHPSLSTARGCKGLARECLSKSATP